MPFRKKCAGDEQLFQEGLRSHCGHPANVAGTRGPLRLRICSVHVVSLNSLHPIMRMRCPITRSIVRVALLSPLQDDGELRSRFIIHECRAPGLRPCYYYYDHH
jgi:hypothetical protein